MLLVWKNSSSEPPCEHSDPSDENFGAYFTAKSQQHLRFSPVANGLKKETFNVPD